jgi:glyoxylase-like metal-dependent hydrolase (beta-lactamase superfamily II)
MAGEDPDAVSESQRLAAYDTLRVRADNPGPLTLSGTNTWVLGRDPAYVVDPGPALESHIDRLLEVLGERGGLGGIALTHDHADHSGAISSLREQAPGALAGARGNVDVLLEDGVCFGPFQAMSIPGHSPDHFALLAGPVCFTGDALLGEGSVFIAPDPGALSGYLKGLERLRGRTLEVLCPGHGPSIWDPQSKLTEYIDHRLDRERRLLQALSAGVLTVADLLDWAWSDVPAQLRPVAAVTLAAHLDKLAEEGLLPEGVERPSW